MNNVQRNASALKISHYTVIGSLFYNLNNRYCKNSLMIFIELHMHSSSEHAHILHSSRSNCYCVLKFACYFAAEIDLIPFFGAI